MRCSALCVLLLAISELLFVHAKVVLVVPRQVRRSPAGTPWRPSPSVHFKKATFGGNDFARQAYYNYGNRFHGKKPFRPLPYPHGGDDFDQGHETVNHVHIPYSKDISHGISFGKGYVPYESIKSASLPFVHERYASTYARQPAVPDYPPTGFASAVGQEYAASATAHTYDSPHVDSFFSDMESAARSELQENLKENSNKYYAARSIENDLNVRNQQALSNAVEKDTLAKGVDLSKNAALSAAYTQAAAAGPTATATATTAVGAQGAVVLPAGIPQTTIAGNKDGIVLRDTVSLDEYHRKLEELTKTWPNVLSGGAGSHSFAVHQPLHTVSHFPAAGLPVAGNAYGGAGPGWFAGYAQAKQGYAVREDHVEPVAHDFRTMPVHAVGYQQLSASPFAVNAGVSAGIAHNHG